MHPTAAAPAESAPKGVDFDREIRPILSDNCFACHGPDEKQRTAGLRLDTKEGAFADRGGYQVIVPGKASESKLYQKISAKDDAVRMPPPGFERNLTAKQIELIRQWIDQGAKWEQQWSFVPPKQPPLPQVKDSSWPRNPIDHFILARLEQAGLKPSPETDKVTLLRRATFDLTGLPPTPAEVDAFLADESTDAYEKVVDRLLNSPRYGERMAMQWLDLARYSDSHGYHIDSLREMWHWRDWAIDAFNRNMPFDEFTVEQLAGDLLPDATLQQQIATGFNRNHMINFEGGAIPEEYQTEYVVNRVSTTSTVWMGLTMGCARCHDHKYDPIKQKEFYQFYAFFNTIPEKGLDGQKGNAAPLLFLPSPEQQRQLDQLKDEIAAREKALPEKELGVLQAKWEKTRLSTMPPPPGEGLVAHYELEGHLADTSGHYQHANIVKGQVTYNPGVVGKAVEFDGETEVELTNTTVLDRANSFSLGVWVNPSAISIGTQEVMILQTAKDSADRPGFQLSFDEVQKLPRMKRGSHLLVRMVHHWPEDSIQIKTKDPLILGSWMALMLTYDGSGKASALKLYVDGKPQEVEVIRDNLSGSCRSSLPLQIGNGNLARAYKGQIDDLRIYDRPLSLGEIENLAIHLPIRAALAGVAGKPFKEISLPKSEEDSEEGEMEAEKESKEERAVKEQRVKLTDYFLTYDAPESFRKAYAELKSLRARKAELEETIPNTMVMREMKNPRETFVLGRGEYSNKGEKVSAGVPASLPPLPKELPRNRLGLAKWLVSPSHPLTSRVVVNRYWQNYFGTGMVKTAEDFGSQGEPPSHAELLDWLATEFMRTGWDVKAMQRLILTSATYRQSSRVTPELLEKDPENRLLARGPRFRLPAETVRDSALAISGLLNGEIGGPSAYPYQPKGLWEELAFGDIFSGQSYTPGSGKDLYRRSMYTVWKRTVPPPSLATFDAPDREKCTARRARTNTPLQALVLLNDPTYVEAARGLAQRMITEAGRDPAQRINFGFRLATARKPEPREVAVLVQTAKQQLAEYRRHKDEAAKLLGVGESKYDPQLDVSELAAWTSVASSILNLDETVSKE
ncbi:MAG: hypothetical protein DMG05_06445 [Acidobacteria bacterium]|nr:MAG: hypothetical protein DMG05_06445 [Acidobacteriota bacterium]